jgi:hypothetical protein
MSEPDQKTVSLEPMVRTVLIPDGDSPWGRAVAKRLAVRGTRIAINTGDIAFAVELARSGAIVLPLSNELEGGDVGESMVARAVEDFGRLDVVICPPETAPDLVERLAHAAVRPLVEQRPGGHFVVLAQEERSAWAEMFVRTCGRARVNAVLITFLSSCEQVADAVERLISRRDLQGRALRVDELEETPGGIPE